MAVDTRLEEGALAKITFFGDLDKQEVHPVVVSKVRPDILANWLRNAAIEVDARDARGDFDDGKDHSDLS